MQGLSKIDAHLPEVAHFLFYFVKQYKKLYIYVNKCQYENM